MITIDTVHSTVCTSNTAYYSKSSHFQSQSDMRSYHGLFCVLVVWVPSYAHHHLMDISTSNTSPSVINASGYVSWETIYYLFRKVGLKTEVNILSVKGIILLIKIARKGSVN